MAQKPTPLGPSGNEKWQEHSIDQGVPYPLSILRLPDAVNSISGEEMEGGYYYYLPKTPLLVRGPNDEPLLSLTLLLTREQHTNEENLVPLIKQGMFTFELTLGIRPEQFSESIGIGLLQYVPLRAREVLFELILPQEDTEKLLASVSATGANAKAGLNVTLDSSEAADVLSALNGTASKIFIRVKASYTVAPQQAKISLSGSWKKVYDFLSSQLDGAGGMTNDALSSYFNKMITMGILSISVVSSSDDEQFSVDIKKRLFDTFLQLSSAVILKKVTSSDESAEGLKYVLQTLPGTIPELRYEDTLSSSTPTDKSRTITAPLETVIGGALNGLERNKFIHAVASI